METAGVIEMFQRSIEKNNLRHHKYLGDGGTSSFKAVVGSKLYEKYNITSTKLECVGHVQKRLKEYKGTSTPIGGRGQLNEKTINSMQNFYGLAIR